MPSMGSHPIHRIDDSILTRSPRAPIQRRPTLEDSFILRPKHGKNPCPNALFILALDSNVVCSLSVASWARRWLGRIRSETRGCDGCHGGLLHLVPVALCFGVGAVDLAQVASATLAETVGVVSRGGVGYSACCAHVRVTNAVGLRDWLVGVDD